MSVLNCASKDVTITFGGTDVTSMLDPKADVDREAILQESTPFGVAWPTFLDSGSKQMAPMTLGGIEDFTAGIGSRAKFAEGTTATFVVTYGGAKSTSVTMIVQKYKSILAPKKSHAFEVVLQPSGTVTES
jgi:hypothetical protein